MDAVRTYNDYAEVLCLEEAAELAGVSHVTFGQWVAAMTTPMGELVEGTHFYRVGRQYRFIKHQLALLFKMI